MFAEDVVGRGEEIASRRAGVSTSTTSCYYYCVINIDWVGIAPGAVLLR
jgi:hypothetical protein